MSRNAEFANGLNTKERPDPEPNKFTDDYARSLGFYDQADMRAEDY